MYNLRQMWCPGTIIKGSDKLTAMYSSQYYELVRRKLYDALLNKRLGMIVSLTRRKQPKTPVRNTRFDALILVGDSLIEYSFCTSDLDFFEEVTER